MHSQVPSKSRTPIGQIAEPIFTKCAKTGCIGGKYDLLPTDALSEVAFFNATGYRCDVGYEDGSPLCSVCDRSLGYAKNGKNACEKCQYSEVVCRFRTIVTIG